MSFINRLCLPCYERRATALISLAVDAPEAMNCVKILSAYSSLNQDPIPSTAFKLKTLLCFCAKYKTTYYKCLKEMTCTASSK
jgi:hypothetical protein